MLAAPVQKGYPRKPTTHAFIALSQPGRKEGHHNTLYTPFMLGRTNTRTHFLAWTLGSAPSTQKESRKQGTHCHSPGRPFGILQSIAPAQWFTYPIHAQQTTMQPTCMLACTNTRHQRGMCWSCNYTATRSNVANITLYGTACRSKPHSAWSCTKNLTPISPQHKHTPRAACKKQNYRRRSGVLPPPPCCKSRDVM